MALLQKTKAHFKPCHLKYKIQYALLILFVFLCQRSLWLGELSRPWTITGIPVVSSANCARLNSLTLASWRTGEGECLVNLVKLENILKCGLNVNDDYVYDNPSIFNNSSFCEGRSVGWFNTSTHCHYPVLFCYSNTVTQPTQGYGCL